MSRDWFGDIRQMHAKYGFHGTVADFTPAMLNVLMEFRKNFLQEEFTEFMDAMDARDPEEVIDALIDMCVVAIGTLDLMGVNAHEAWDRVHAANMAKERGIKPNRPNPLGLPDLMKPKGWEAPTHEGNHGSMALALKEEAREADDSP